MKVKSPWAVAAAVCVAGSLAAAPAGADEGPRLSVGYERLSAKAFKALAPAKPRSAKARRAAALALWGEGEACYKLSPNVTSGRESLG